MKGQPRSCDQELLGQVSRKLWRVNKAAASPQRENRLSSGLCGVPAVPCSLLTWTGRDLSIIELQGLLISAECSRKSSACKKSSVRISHRSVQVVFSKMACTLRLLVVVFVAHVMSWSSSAQDLNPDVVKAANFAIDSHNRKCNCAYAYKVVDVLSQSEELYPPTWVKYSIKVRVAETNCRNNGEESLGDCSLMANGQTMICNFVVLAVPGENTVPNHLLSDHCAK